MGAKTERRHAQGDESRERILEAATQVASQRGYHGTSISAVSALSGLPTSSIYWHFTNKDDLIAAVIQRSFEAWLNSHRLMSLRRPDAESGEHLAASMSQHAAALIDNPEFLRLGLMLALERDPQEPSARAMFLDVRQQAFALLVEAFDQTLQLMHGASDQPRARSAAVIAMAAADGLFIAHQIDADSIDLESEFERLAHMVNLSMQAPPVRR
jgi:AcrR family transcriptional regulator